MNNKETNSNSTVTSKCNVGPPVVTSIDNEPTSNKEPNSTT